ncbi:MAG TPA: 2,3-bisphosphoglycerate-independent phosphoglycerate mutase, partial [Solirubrobacteraceae bacterium]|nr:2,3-bisphosphoglycerate-independent phosphoglycerate mutase [Solirubrobacteraceae bacterium]
MSAPLVPCVCLVVLDGWGLAEAGPGNAVSLARTPVFDELWETCPHTTLTASGRAVGLPEGQMGNSEVGHLNLGAGAVVRQDLTRIDDAVADGVLSENPAIVHALTCAERVHLIGLVSDGGVHSSLGHLRALLELAARLSVRDLAVHCFTDGRDTPPKSGVQHVGRVERWCREIWPPDTRGGARIGSVVGRWWAMDRDRRWERIQAAYDLLVHGRAPHHEATGVEAVRNAYARGETDEFIAPTTVGEEALIRPWDSVLCFNFRPDRAREITRALAEPGFGEPPGTSRRGPRKPPATGGPAAGEAAAGVPAEIEEVEGAPAEELPGWEGRRGIEPVDQYTTLTGYEEDWSYPIAFPPQRPAATLASVLAAARACQLHVAETEKYAHVTYFFNGGEEASYEGERRELAPSVREVPTYDLAPEMSARTVTDRFLAAWRAGGTGCVGDDGGAGEHGGAQHDYGVGDDRGDGHHHRTGDGGELAVGGGRDAAGGGFRFVVINFANPDMVGHTGVIEAAVTAIEAVDACLGDVVTAVHESGGACLITADHGNADHMLEDDGSPNTAHSL